MKKIEHYNDSGSGTPLVLVHAFPFNGEMWELQQSALARYCRVVTIDLPGFGRDGGPACTSMEQCADAVADLLDRLKIDTCVLGGCSMGGYIVMSFLQRHADRLRGILLSDTRAGADTEEGRASRLTQAAGIRASGLSEFIEGMLPKLLGATAKDADPTLEPRVRAMMARATPEGTARMLEAMAARRDSHSLLAALAIPACIIVGEHDILTPPVEARAMAEAISDSELHVLSGAAHLPNLETPEAFNSTVERFLSLRFN
jgi:pimeloyl-ACP methyl ester carboxylesterase